MCVCVSVCVCVCTCVYCENVHVHEWEKKRESVLLLTQTCSANAKHNKLYRLQYSSIHWGLHTFVKKKRGVSQRGSEKERQLRWYYTISDHQHRMKKECALLDAILEKEKNFHCCHHLFCWRQQKIHVYNQLANQWDQIMHVEKSVAEMNYPWGMCVVWTQNVLFSSPIAWGKQSETTKTAIQFHYKTHWLMKIYHQIKFDNKMISSSEDLIETVMIIRTLAVTMNLKIVNQPFCMTL